MSAPTLPWLEEARPRDLVRWAAAAVVVLGLHAVAVAFVLSRHTPVAEIGMSRR